MGRTAPSVTETDHDKPLFLLPPRLESITPWINQFEKKEHDKFRLFVSRILQKTMAKEKNFFSSEEMNHLRSIFSCPSIDQIQDLIATCTFLFAKAMFFSLTPPAFSTQLATSLGFNPSNCKLFEKLWEKYSQEYSQAMTSGISSTAADLQLQMVRCTVAVEMAQDTIQGQAEPKAMFEFDLSRSTSSQMDEDNDIETLRIEMEEKDLVHLFNQLNQVQEQLDRVYP